VADYVLAESMAGHYRPLQRYPLGGTSATTAQLAT